MASIGFLCVRLAVAVVLFAHGAHTLFGAFAGPAIGPGGIDQLTAHYVALGLQPALALAALTGVVQVAGSLLLLIGWLARYAAAVNGLVVILGIWREQAAWGFFLNWTGDPNRGHGVEYAIVLLAAMLLIVFAGAGDLSIDGRKARRVAARAAGRARLRMT